MSDSVVEVRGLSRQFGKQFALRDVSLSISSGLVYGLVGVNGAGKTTLIKHLLGLLKAKTGTVKLFGLDPIRNPVEVLGRVGYLSEERELPEWMRIDELLRYTAAFYPGWDWQYASELIDTFGLDARKKVNALSKGMRAQTGLIAAVAHRPELLLLDEPSSGLDPVVRKDILNAVIRTVAEDGRTVIFSSHLLDEVEMMSDYLYMIHKGQVVVDGELDEIKSRHQTVSIRWNGSPEKPPIEAAFASERVGESWRMVCGGSGEQVRERISASGGEVLELRTASLQEIFSARAGRSDTIAEGVA
jgi:ABC-2 type transport system ATP-binding protein